MPDAEHISEQSPEQSRSNSTDASKRFLKRYGTSIIWTYNASLFGLAAGINIAYGSPVVGLVDGLAAGLYTVNALHAARRGKKS